MTTMTDERVVGDLLQQHALEQKAFNTGPQANKAYPIAQSSVNGGQHQPHQLHHHQTLVHHPHHHQPSAPPPSYHANHHQLHPHQTLDYQVVGAGGGGGGAGASGPVQTCAAAQTTTPTGAPEGAGGTEAEVEMTSSADASMYMQPTMNMRFMQSGSIGNGRLGSPTDACMQPMSEDSIDGQLRSMPSHQATVMKHQQQQMAHHQQQLKQMQQHHYMQQQQQQQYPMHQMQNNQVQYHYQQPAQQYQYNSTVQQQQQQQQHIQAAQVNESSNLSSAGSMSEHESSTAVVGTPQRPIPPPTTEKKSARKRRRITVDDHGTPKNERKITEYIKNLNQTSPKRFMGMSGTAAATDGPPTPSQQGGGSNGNTYGSAAATGPTGDMHVPQQLTGIQQMGTYWAASPSPVSRTTPTPQQYSSDSNSNSNQSPPGSLPKTVGGGPRVDEETQTDGSSIASSQATAEEIAKRDRAIDDYRRQVEELQLKMRNEQRKNDACKETIKRLLIEKSAIERRTLREKTTSDTPRIGCFKTMRTGDSFRDQWTDGWAFDELDKKQQQIVAERNEIANASALLKKRKPLGIGKEGAKRQALNAQLAAAAAAESGSAALQPSTSGNDDAIFRRPEEPKEINYQEYIELDEIYKLRREHLKKEEMDVQLEREKLDRERQLHIRELKRAGNEQASTYKNFSLLNKRYLMLCLLGKGGFSEVWKAFDVEENRYVACKIHHVNKDWKEEKKANYVKHAMREKDIHKSLDHCRIVKLYDLFTIDNHSFCTVLEYCPGNDLDFYLKQNKQISEKEARSIIMQVVSALVYLNEKRDPIIHYDLKPANILLESGNACGAIKITDFGLSKIMEGSEADHEHDGIELTSQFAGTYWYLPPETFIVPPPKITCKVDVWSVGVIFYQCIYGKKPFGNELTQQKILEYNTIINAREVSFPPKPPVSSVAQDFIRRCLQYKKEDRADVFELAKHELFRPRGASRANSAGSVSPCIPRSLSVSRDDESA